MTFLATLLLSSILIAGMMLIIGAVQKAHFGPNLQESQIQSLAGMLMIALASAMFIGIIISRKYNRADDELFQRMCTQTQCHTLSQEMLQSYYQHDPDYFYDVIMEEDAYCQYDSIVGGDWGNFFYDQ